MSPEFRLRPSLSVVDAGLGPAGRRVSPEFRLRPSLSAPDGEDGAGIVYGVAGVQTPAFVERSRLSPIINTYARGVAGVQTPAFVERAPRWPWMAEPACAGVAGVQTPAFVERPSRTGRALPGSTVSPEFRLRPSLSEGARGAGQITGAVVSPEFRLRPSLSVAYHAVAVGVVHEVLPEFRLRPSLSGCNRGEAV